MEQEYTLDQLKGEDTQGRPYRVLIVDDEDKTRNLIARVVRSAFYEVVGEATDGRQAIAKYKILKPDIVTLDVKMPHADGYEALQGIKEFDQHATILMLTHEDSKETVMKILKAGANDYLLKPVNRSKILHKLKKIRKAMASTRNVSTSSYILDEQKHAELQKKAEKERKEAMKKMKEKEEAEKNQEEETAASEDQTHKNTEETKEE